MAKKKYEIVKEYSRTMPDGTVLHRIRALKKLNNCQEVKKGELGGWVEGYHNLSQEGDSWLYDESAAYQNARVFDDAVAFGNATLFGNARMFDTATAYHDSKVSGNARVGGCSYINDETHITECASLSGSAGAYGKTIMKGDARATDKVILCDATIGGGVTLLDAVNVCGTSIREGYYEGAYTITFPVSSRDDFATYDGVIEGKRAVNSIVAHTSKNLWSFEGETFKNDKALKKYFKKRGRDDYDKMKALMKFHRKMFNIEE